MFDTIIELNAVKRVDVMAKECRFNGGGIGVFCGDAGTGKTTASKYYYERNKENTVFITAKVTCTVKKLFCELSESIGLEVKKSVNDNYDVIKKHLENSERLIIIDEAQFLPYKALELLRALNDETKCGIMLVGMEQLYHNLKGRRGEYIQLYSRVDVYLKTIPLTLEEIEELTKEFIPNCKKLSGEFLKVSNGNLRLLKKIIRRCLTASKTNNVEINKDIITAVKEALL
jgi:hypothetical protein